MLPIEVLLGMGMLCSTNKIDERLDAVQREARFIIKTIARLRHMQNVSLLFGLGRQTDNQLYFDDLWQQSMAKCRNIFRRMLGPEQQDVIQDVERVAIEPVHVVGGEVEHPPCLVPGSPMAQQANLRRSASVPRKPSIQAAMERSTIDSRRLSHPPPRPFDTIQVVVDAGSQSIFDIPKSCLPAMLQAQKLQNLTLNHAPVTCLYLPNINVADFNTFNRWTRTGRILQNTSNGCGWYIEHQAYILVSALALGIKLRSTEYQNAAMTEFVSLGHLLTWPEDYVNPIFAATGKALSLGSGRQHPARQMIVAVVAAKTCGKGKRRVRQGLRVMGVEGNGERVASKTFWRMYDKYCQARKNECEYPRSLREVLGGTTDGNDNDGM